MNSLAASTLPRGTESTRARSVDRLDTFIAGELASVRSCQRYDSAFPTCRLSSQIRVPGIGGEDITGVDPVFEFVGGESGCMVRAVGSCRRIELAIDQFSGLRRFWDSVREYTPAVGAAGNGSVNDGGMIGYLSYEAGLPLLGMASQDAASAVVPPVRFVYFRTLRRMPTSADRVSEAVSAGRRGVSSDDVDELLMRLGGTRSVTRHAYREAIRHILEHIADGDIYQANYTQRFTIPTGMTGEALAARLCAGNPAPFAAHLRFADCEIVSSSPERLLRIDGSRIETRPIKGTAARGADRAADRRAWRRLVHSAKDRAELLMITDLERNDLGRVCDFGTVQVARLARPERYASVWHLVGCVQGRLRDGCGWHDALGAVFPGGSVTGAPKIRAVEILNELEAAPRSVYCGAVGWVDARGNADFNLAIRTVILKDGVAHVGCGGGIVTDSDPDAEYRESLIKIAPIVAALDE